MVLQCSAPSAQHSIYLLEDVHLRALCEIAEAIWVCLVTQLLPLPAHLCLFFLSKRNSLVSTFLTSPHPSLLPGELNWQQTGTEFVQ